jgi:class 3 adenylate cyclase
MAAGMHTFLFTDLVGFTALTAERGDDHAADVALDFSLRARELAQAREAEVVKTLGDGLMVRCPDPTEAVHLGLEIVEGLADVPGFPAIRAGMHTGPAVERQGDWYGATVNVASRLCSAAGGGEVLVSEATAHAAPSLREVRLGERRLHWLKNVTEPVAAHPAAPAPSLATRIAARLPARLRCPAAARGAQLQGPSSIPEALA